MSGPWWKKIKHYVKGNEKTAPLILTISQDPVLEESLGEALDDSMDLIFSDGQHSIEGVLEHGRPSLIIGDAVLLSNSTFGQELKKSDWKDIPLLLVTADGRSLSEFELRRFGAAAQIKSPYDIDEIRQKIMRLLPVEEHPGSEAVETAGNLSGDPDNETTQKIKLQPPLRELPRDKNFDSELHNLLADIDQDVKPEEKPDTDLHGLTDSLEELETLTEGQEHNYGDLGAFAEAENAPEESQPSPADPAPPAPVEAAGEQKPEPIPGGNDMFIKSATAVTDPDTVGADAAPMAAPSPAATGFSSPEVEAWFRAIIEETVARIVKQTDLNTIVGNAAKEIVPKVAEELVIQEIERIKKRIREE